MSKLTLLPVGTILAYASDKLDLLDDSWLLCDGSILKRTDFRELWDAIGTAYGAPTDTEFRVPELRGLFIRGCDNGTGRDTRANSRTKLNDGGNTQDNVGSYQVYGTGIPKNAFVGTFKNSKLKDSADDTGCDARPGKWNNDATIVTPSRGGDAESRCRNIYINWVIKAFLKSRSRSSYAMVPIGAVISFGGLDGKLHDSLTWFLCDGSHVATVGMYTDLSARINFAFGAPQAPQEFYLPDFRGQFLRGRDWHQNRDPDAATRTAPRPDEKPPGRQGADNDAVGSVQLSATALPQTPFTSTIYNLPRETDAERVAGSLYDLTSGFDGATDVNVTQGGGDRETRPRNLAVDWFVAYDQTGGSDPDDKVPVGAIVAIGVQRLDNDSFLLCDGRTLSQEQYPELHAMIGELYGGDPAKKQFNIPDCRGIFLRGADHGAGVDPDAAARKWAMQKFPDGTAGSFQDDATALPTESHPFFATVPHIPTARLGAHGTANNPSRILDDLLTTTCTGGGDGDSAPANVYVQYFIKVRS